MNQYEVLEGQFFTLAKITPNRLKMLKKAGIDILSEDEKELQKLIVKGYFQDEELLKAMVQTIFNEKFDVSKIGDVNLPAVKEAFNDFFYQFFRKKEE